MGSHYLLKRKKLELGHTLPTFFFPLPKCHMPLAIPVVVDCWLPTACRAPLLLSPLATTLQLFGAVEKPVLRKSQKQDRK